MPWPRLGHDLALLNTVVVSSPPAHCLADRRMSDGIVVSMRPVAPLLQATNGNGKERESGFSNGCADSDWFPSEGQPREQERASRRFASWPIGGLGGASDREAGTRSVPQLGEL